MGAVASAVGRDRGDHAGVVARRGDSVPAGYVALTLDGRSLALQAAMLGGVCVLAHSALPLGVIWARRIAVERYSALRGPVGMLAVMLAVGAIYGAHTPAHHAEAANNGKRTARFIGKEMAKSGVGKKVAHQANLLLRDGHDVTIGGKQLTTYRYKSLFPKQPLPRGDLGDAVREYLRIYGDAGRAMLRLIRDIGHHRTAGVWPFVPPGAPGIGGGAGLPL